MNKKIALITLIEVSMVATPEEKLVLIDMVPELTDVQVDALGKYFARERNIVLANESEILNDIQVHLNAPEAIADTHESDAVYVGVGKPS